MLRFLPHLPFPFLAPSHSLPLCIFKPVKLPQLHPPHPLHRGRGPRPPLVWAPVGCLLGLGCVGGRGQTTSPWDLEGLGDKPQAQGMEPAGGGGGRRDLPKAVRGSGQRLEGCWESGLPTGQFVLTLGVWGKDWQQ